MAKENASPKSGFAKELSRFYLCVLLAMTVQMLPLALWSFSGPNGLDGVLDYVYGPVVSGIGTLFFEEQMFLGNIGLGLSLLFLTVMLYSAAGGAVIYLVCRLSSLACRGRKQQEN